MRIERRVDLVPEPGFRAERLAAAARDRARRVNLVRGTAHDDHGARKPSRELGERERSTDDAAGDGPVPAGVDGLDAPVRPHRQ